MLRPKQYHFLFCLFFYALNLFAQDKGKAISLSKILADIEQRHQVSFNYLEENITEIRLIPPKKSLSLEQKLQYLTQKTNLSFENIDNRFINIFKANNNEQTICGYVFSSVDKKPIEDANINLSGKIHVTTDSNGYFEIAKSNKNALTISHLGFVAKRISTASFNSKNCTDFF